MATKVPKPPHGAAPLGRLYAWADVLRDFEALSPLNRRRVIGAYLFGHLRLSPRLTRTLLTLAGVGGGADLLARYWHLIFAR